MRKLALVFSAGLWLLATPLALARQPNRISAINLRGQGAETVVEIAGDRAPDFTTFKQNNPRRIIVDVAESALDRVPGTIRGDGILVEGVSAYQVGSGPGRISRVVIQLRGEAEYRVTVSGGRLLVHLRPGAGGLLASAGVPLAPGDSTGDDRGRDLALAEELSPPAMVAVSTTSASEPAEDDEPAAASPVRSTERGARADAPEPPRGVVAGPLDQPRETNTAEPAGTEPTTDEAQAGSNAAPREARPVPVMVAAVYPRQQGSAASRQPLVAQQEPDQVGGEAEEAEEAEEVEEVEEVPVEVEEAVPEAGQPPAEEGLPPPPPPPPAESETAPPPTAEQEPPPPPPPPPDEHVDLGGEVRRMTWVGFQQTQEASRVFVKTNAPVKYRLTEEGDRLVVLELENTVIPLRNNRRFLDTHFFDSAVTMITPRELAGVNSTVRIEIELRQRVPYQARQEDNVVYVSFQRPQ